MVFQGTFHPVHKLSIFYLYRTLPITKLRHLVKFPVNGTFIYYIEIHKSYRVDVQFSTLRDLL